MQSIRLFLIAVSAALVTVFGAPVDPVATPYILQYESNNAANEGYSFEFELSDEQKRKEEGTLRFTKDAEGNDVSFVAVQGHYSFVGDDGRTYYVEYTADENGYRTRMSADDYPGDTDRSLAGRAGSQTTTPASRRN